MSRILLSAILAFAAFAVTADAQAQNGRRYHSRSQQLYLNGSPYWGYYRGNGWWWGQGWFSSPHYRAPWYNSAGYNYPGFYNNHSFWERVQTQANYPVQY